METQTHLDLAGLPAAGALARMYQDLAQDLRRPSIPKRANGSGRCDESSGNEQATRDVREHPLALPAQSPKVLADVCQGGGCLPGRVGESNDEDACPLCRGLGYVRQDVPPGHPDFGKLFPCPGQAHVDEHTAQLYALSGLKAHERRYAVDRIVNFGEVTPQLTRTIQTFLDDPQGWLYVWGGPGNGKTLALMAVVNAFIQRGMPALYVTLADLLDLMRETFVSLSRTTFGRSDEQRRDTYQTRFERVQSVKLLAIDEFDSAKINETPFVAEFRARLIDHRYRDAIAGQTFTLFAGNEDPSSLPAWIYDRVRDGRFTVWENKGESVRPWLEW